MYTYQTSDLETIDNCPTCGACDHDNATIHSGVQDWAFKCVSGEWNIKKCFYCDSIYLNPRPKMHVISYAYAHYYTHTDQINSKSIEKLENEIIFHWLKVDKSPRFNMRTSFFFKIIRSSILYRYPLEEIIKYPKGSILDIGCGSGYILSILKELGWEVFGLEMDEKAALVAQNRGINVKIGTYEIAKEFNREFDILIASHVIEHTYNPANFIDTLLNCTKNQHGKIFLSYPNPNSVVHKIFSRYWRGLEVPRHISLPSTRWIKNYVTKKEASIKITSSPIITVWGSYQIFFGKSFIVGRLIGKILQLIPAPLIPKNYSDLTQIEITKH